MADGTDAPERRETTLQQLLDSVTAPLRGLANAAQAAQARLGVWYTENEPAILEAVQTLTFVGVATARPENWQELRSAELMLLQRVAVQDQMCLVWVPRTATVRRLLACPDLPARRTVLVARRGGVLEDCRRALAAAGPADMHGEQREIHRLAGRAVDAARDGHDEAAQTLAGSVLTAVIHRMLGFANQGRARDTLLESCGDAELQLFMLRELVLYGATARVIANTTEGLPGFNRHATAHGHSGWFDQADMLEAVMLTSAWMRELAFQDQQAQLYAQPPAAADGPNGVRALGRGRTV